MPRRQPPKSQPKNIATPLAGTGISNKLKLSYFIASIIPIIVMTYLYLNYITPEAEKRGNSNIPTVIAILLVLTVFLSVMGLILTNRAAGESISTLKTLNTRMDTLLDLTKNFREGFYVDVLLDSIASSATKLLNAEASSVLLYDETGLLKFAHLSGRNAAALKGREVKLGEGLTGWVAREGKPVILNDVKSDPRFSAKYDQETDFKTRSMLCVPLVMDGRNIGVLEVLNKKDGELFSEQDLKILFSLADHAALSIYRTKSNESSHTDFIQVTEILLSAMDYHIPEKKGHARRVARYSVKIAKDMGLNEDEQKRVYFGALLHDIGLLKYDKDEYWGQQKFELHSNLGYDMIKSISIWQPTAPLVLSHHERYDGKGYPKGISGTEIPLGARIIAVAETFDTIVSARSYKPTMSFAEAVTELRANSGTQFDPNVVDVFAANFKKEDIME
jgi:HD-GYP domain-containing protein (c-di-GMP phosphodiesterase class II)